MLVYRGAISPYSMPELGRLQPVLVGGLGLEEAAHEGEVEPDRRLQLLRRVVRVGQQLQHARPRLLQVAQNLQNNNHYYMAMSYCLTHTEAIFQETWT